MIQKPIEAGGSSRNRLSQKPLSPQLDKQTRDQHSLFKDIYANNNQLSDNSYIKRMKQFLMERTNQVDTMNDDTKNNNKISKDTSDIVNLKKLRDITNSKNMFIGGGGLLGSQHIEQNTDNVNKSGTRSPRTANSKDKELYKESQFSSVKTLLNPQMLKERKQENDISSVSAKEKSISVSKQSNKQSSNTSQVPLKPKEIDEVKEKEKEEENALNMMFEINADLNKTSKIKLLSNTEEQVYSIYNQITQDKDPYETIRSYSDIAQNNQFNTLENIFKNKAARLLFSRLLKLERWMVVYLFYFTIQDLDKDRNKLIMIEIADMMYRNMSFIVSWICRTSDYNKKSFDQMFKNVSSQVTILKCDSRSFFEALHLNNKDIASKLGLITKEMNKQANEVFSKFIDNIDKWSITKSFEKGFECFYEVFIEKGVISVNYQDKENNQNTNSESKEEGLKDTPRKFVCTTKHQGDETPTERKSFGDRLIIQELKDCEGFQSFEEMREPRKIDSPFFLFQPDTHKVKQKKPLLPDIKSDREYTLVLDLDETLIHFEENADGTNHFLLRPYAQNFVKEVSRYYEVVIFTAALKDYADYILDRLDTEKNITHRLYRNNCSFSDNVYQKDLTKLGRDLSKTLIVDNNAENFQLQPDNGIYIRSWYSDPNDEALRMLAPLLVGRIVLI